MKKLMIGIIVAGVIIFMTGARSNWRFNENDWRQPLLHWYKYSNFIKPIYFEKSQYRNFARLFVALYQRIIWKQ